MSSTRKLNALFLLLAALFCTVPAYLAQRELWRRVGREHEQLELFAETFASAEQGSVLLVGDSTVAFHRLQKGMPPDRGVTVAGEGGSGAELWRYVLERALDSGLRPGAVVFAALSTSRMRGLLWTSPLQPHLMGPRGILGAWRRGEIGLSLAGDLLHQWLFPLRRASDYVLFQLLSKRSPKLGAWIFQARPPNQGNTHDPEARGLQSLLAYGKEKGVRMHFVLSPLSGEYRAQPQWLEPEDFRRLCAQFSLECTDLSAALPDSVFHSDKTHVKTEERHLFLDAMLKAAASR